MSLGIAIAFALLALVTPYATPQVGDLLLSWSDVYLPGPATFGIAGILLLGLVLQESAIELVASPEAGANRDGIRRRRANHPALRAVTVVVLLGLLVAFVAPGYADPGTAVLILPVLLIVLALWAERELSRHEPRPPDPPSGASFLGVGALPLLALAGGLTNATVDALFLFGPDDVYRYRAIVPALLLLACIGALAWSTRRVRWARPEAEADWHPWTAAAAGIGVATLAWVAVLALDDGEGGARVAGALALAGLLAYTALIRHEGRLWAVAIARVAGVALVVAILAAPVATGRGIGTMGIIGILLAAAVSLVHYLVRLFALVGLPGPLRSRIPLRGVPVVSLLAAWVVVAFTAAPPTRHDVRLRAAPPATAAGVDLDTAFDAWWAAQPESRRPGRAGETVPLVLVAAEGGGIRASYWAAGALDVLVAGTDDARRAIDVPPDDLGCETDRDAQRERAGRVFAVSGASGGSVGAYAYARELREAGCLQPRWYARWFAQDLLTPAIGWGLAHDLPAVLLHQRPGDGGGCNVEWLGVCSLFRDRARMLEVGLDDDPAARVSGLRNAFFAAPAPVPHLIFNTSTDDLRTRVPLSTLRLEQRRWISENGFENLVDGRLVDGCADADVPWVSAAFLSARFPLVTPTGRLECSARSLVDGGYLENTGLGSLAELLPRLTARIRAQNAANAEAGLATVRLVVLEISNGRVGAASPVRDGWRARTPDAPKEALLGLAGLPRYPTDVARDELGRAAAGACAAGVDIALVTIRPPLQPGWEASVGWRMSRAARDELEHGLAAAAATPGRGLGLADRLLDTAPQERPEECPWNPR